MRKKLLFKFLNRNALWTTNFRLSKIMFLALSLFLCGSVDVFSQENIAVYATASTSKVSDWEKLSAVNDGFEPDSSADRTNGVYGNWQSSGGFNWVQYEWAVDCIINSVSIYWFTDKGGILIPDTAYIEYFSNNEWSASIHDVPRVSDQYNTVELGGIVTNKIRVVMKSNTESTGIIEFKAFGSTQSGVADFVPPSAPGKPQIVNSTSEKITLKFDAATDNNAVKEYKVFVNDTLFASTTETTTAITNPSSNKMCYLYVKAFDATGNSSASEGIWFFAGESAAKYQSYVWPSYNPTISYDFRDEFPSITEPTRDLDDCKDVAGTISSGWWTFKWGANKRSEITEAAITPLLERMNQDFAYFRDTLGWPPDKRAKNGYRSAVYLYGSGLCTDDADTTALGGWQSAVEYNNESWPLVLASYYPIYSFDPSCPYTDRESQMGAMVHEGIHSILADMPGCRQAAWFHEGGNTWLQQEMESRKSKNYSTMGFLNVANLVAPFMPIECYTGWLQDDSFGGPSAEGVNMFEGSQQICTWRNLLGGTQYGNAFPTFMGQTLGPKSVAWVWRNCPGRVLEGIGEGIGEMQIRKLIMEYRAKQALLDMKEWTGAFRKLLNDNMKKSIKAEWQPSWLAPEEWLSTPYANTTYDKTTKTLTPEYRTTPGWSGGNIIPLNVTGLQIGDTVLIEFLPIGKNMSCQLCYRATDATPVYGKPVSDGMCGLILDKEPANNVVFAVIANTDYIYKGEETRKSHFDYRIKLISGVKQKANIYKKWYNYEDVIEDEYDELPTGFNAPIDGGKSNCVPTINTPESNVVKIAQITPGDNVVNVFDVIGKKIDSHQCNESEFFYDLNTLPSSGVYILTVTSNGKTYSFKVFKK